MRADLLIVGQGLAGTWLAWECERAGIAFAIRDAGHAGAASRVAAGIINPVTGRRLVKSWRVDEWLPAARAAYRELESVWAVPLWREMRVRRLFADQRERDVATSKRERGELAPYVRAAPDETGCWIEGAARVDLPVLLAAARARWSQQGRLQASGVVELRRETEKYDLVVDCRGIGGTGEPDFRFVPWEFSKGEMLEIEVGGLEPDVVLNAGEWVLPLGEGQAWVGSTHEPGVTDLISTSAAREKLVTRAGWLLGGRPFSVGGHFAGVRVNLPDKRPLAGRHPDHPRLGVVNGLGAKGALWAPILARQWVNHLTEGVAFEAELSVERFGELRTSNVQR